MIPPDFSNFPPIVLMFCVGDEGGLSSCSKVQTLSALGMGVGSGGLWWAGDVGLVGVRVPPSHAPFRLLTTNQPHAPHACMKRAPAGHEMAYVTYLTSAVSGTPK